VAPEVRLREVEPADLRVLFDHQRDPQAVAMADVPPRDVEAFRTHWDALLRDRAVVTRTILADGEVAGHALSFERNGRRLVGYWLGREHWGRGIASRALVAFLELLPAGPLHATVAEHNVASRRVLEKADFRLCGREAGGLMLRLG
jgi:RimJ/RimL family protein N-acetyltransferase